MVFSPVEAALTRIPVLWQGEVNTGDLDLQAVVQLMPVCLPAGVLSPATLLFRSTAMTRVSG